MPRKPKAVEVAATAALPPTLIVALLEAGVLTLWPITRVVGEVLASGTLLSGMVLLWVPETAPTPRL
jgi:hypothetical protein